jgi:hypothetical protein
MLEMSDLSDYLPQDAGGCTLEACATRGFLPPLYLCLRFICFLFVSDFMLYA